MARVARMMYRIRAAFAAAWAALRQALSGRAAGSPTRALRQALSGRAAGSPTRALRQALSGAFRQILSGRVLIRPGRRGRSGPGRGRHPFGIRDGCLVTAHGQPPVVAAITSPTMLGVHRAAPSAGLVTMDGQGPVADVYPGAPAYVPRHFDGDLAERVAAGGFVLLVGDSAAGKTRSAFQAISVTVPGHVLICPAGRGAVAAAVAMAAEQRRCVLWLDNLEQYLGSGGLTADQAERLLGGAGPGHRDGQNGQEAGLLEEDGGHRVIVATIRAAEYKRLTDGERDDDGGRRIDRGARDVLDLASPVRVDRSFTPAEVDRAWARDWDPRIADALRHARTSCVAEHLAAGPELLRGWETARGAAEPGAALVSAAVDIRRAGYTSPLPRALIDRVHRYYLEGSENATAPAGAWAWATHRRMAGTQLLRVSGPGLVQVFDYLVDTAQRQAGCLGGVPDPVARATIECSGPAEADSIAAAAYREGRYDLAELAWRRACEVRTSDTDLGPDHPDTLATRGNIALALRASGRLREAEAEHRAVVEAMTRVLGAEYPDTLAGRDNLASVLHDSGRLEEAEAERREVVETMTRVLGPDHPDTLTGRSNLASLLHAQGQLEEAEAEHRAVVEAMTRVLGPDHPDTLTCRNNLASVLRDLGRLEEAEAEHRAELEACSRVLGPDHPDTLTSRGNLAGVLRDLGRLEEAEAEYWALAEAMGRVLGPDDRDTLAAHRNLASVLHARGRLEEAEAEHRDVLDRTATALGPDHPDTLNSRGHLGLVLYARGRLEEAEAEHRAVAEALSRVLGRDHPDTLTSRGNLALVLYARGELDEAEAEQRSLIEAMTRVLGPDHPATLSGRGNLALTLRALGRFGEAENEYRAVAESRTRVLGPDHPDTLTSRSSLATVLRSRGRQAAPRPVQQGGEPQPAAARPAKEPGETTKTARRPKRDARADADPAQPSGPADQPGEPAEVAVLTAETAS